MTDKEFESELERRFDKLWRERKAARVVYQEADRIQCDLNAKLYAMAGMLWGEHADEFMKGYPEDGRPHLKEKG